MSLLQKVANAISKAAGWRIAVPDANGVVRFVMNDGLDMELFSLDDRTAVFRSEICQFSPHAPDTAQLLQKAAHMAVGAMRNRGSVLSLADHRLMLHSTVSMDSPDALFSETAKDFLNDLVWWRTQLTETRTTAPASPFTMTSFSLGRP